MRDREYMPSFAQRGDRLTTSFGTPVSDTDNSLTVSSRGPTLLEDFHLRDKIMHFDHERIPERVVHARGNGAHGVFRPYESLADITCAEFLGDPDLETPVFVRFSTVLGSRGASETTREVRGFATKFYTTAGNFDLVGNNIPVFFIQDGIKFPDLIHAAKPEPHNEIPQSASAHDTFWDFVSLLPESTHMLLWAMSDRALPRSYRMMQGFGVHTFRLVNARGATTLVKFHWTPVLGIHSMLWEEYQKLAGVDPDFLRRDLHDAIEAGAFPEYELGIQVFPDTDDQMFEGIDLLDSTKLVPEEMAPVRPIGRMVLNRNTTDFFAESEQVAYDTGHLVTGIEGTDDPLLQARNFSYFDTQLTRLGGPNFEALPINRPRSPVNSMQQDGFGQTAILAGRTRYSPNSLGGGCPFMSGFADGGYEHAPREMRGPKITRACHTASRLLQPGDDVLAQHEPARAGPHRGRVLVRARQGGGCPRPCPHAAEPGRGRCRPHRARRRRTWHGSAGAERRWSRRTGGDLSGTVSDASGCHPAGRSGRGDIGRRRRRRRRCCQHDRRRHGRFGEDARGRPPPRPAGQRARPAGACGESLPHDTVGGVRRGRRCWWQQRDGPRFRAIRRRVPPGGVPPPQDCGGLG